MNQAHLNRSQSAQSGQKYLTLREVVCELEKFAPLELAESWDNVGLLVEPTAQRLITKALLVNDITEGVLAQAIQSSVEMIISFHSPICSPLTKVTQSNWRERVIVRCLENRIAVYSPHTAWHVSENGVNDEMCHLINIGQRGYRVRPIIPHPSNELRRGSGRLIEYTEELRLEYFIEQAQNLFDLKHVQIAMGCGHNRKTRITTVALCAGSRSGILKNVQADLYITEEMSHHDVLDAIHQGTSVILLNHTICERMFLQKFCRDFNQKLVSRQVSTRLMLDELHDKEPLITH
ncbi:NIF3-like protein 1 [Pseudolycoriella hygida]|uniref:NIF3-like protein 1 n=1 Tax=Pseudolycoriella hygida TaxID=35572 RepID=A0A9Q0S7N5_9DIPT|nr:NIF3-like protein 1 [Pseudolycoriella hygida]